MGYAAFSVSLEDYQHISDPYKHLFTAIVVSGIGITIHIAKKRTIDKEMLLVADAMVIMMFMIIPATTSFEVLQNEIKQQPIIILGIFLATLVSWFLISLYLIDKEFHGKGDKVFSYVWRFFSILLVFGVALTLFVMYLQSLIPK